LFRRKEAPCNEEECRWIEQELKGFQCASCTADVTLVGVLEDPVDQARLRVVIVMWQQRSERQTTKPQTARHASQPRPREFFDTYGYLP